MTTITTESLISQIDAITETQWLEGALEEVAPGCPRVLRELGYTVEVSVDEDGDNRVDLTSPDGTVESVWVDSASRVRTDLDGVDEMAELLRVCCARRHATNRSAAPQSAVLETIDSCREVSARAWEGAADGAERDGHDRAPVEAAAEECDGHYEAAEEAIRGGNIDGAIAALEWAASLEREWGDAQHAERALNAVRSVASGDTVTDEQGAELRRVCLPETLSMYVRSVDQGQIVEVSYGYSCEDSLAWKRVLDRSDRSEEWYVGELDWDREPEETSQDHIPCVVEWERVEVYEP